jgi:hypothetical protein
VETGGGEHNGAFTTEMVYTAELTLAAVAGYTFAGVGANAFSHAKATSVTNVADSGAVTIVFPGAEAEIVIGEPVSAENLAAYLAKLPEGSTESPSMVKLEPFDVTSNTWGTTVKAALVVSQKYIVLDLSDCTATNNTISGDTSPSGNHFNIINGTYIAGLILPDSLVTIGNAVCYNWSNLKTVAIPETVTSIGVEAFEAAGLTSVTIPAGVTAIAMMTFYDCSSLTSVTLLRTDGVVSLSNYAFTNTHESLEIFVPAALVDAYKTATNWKDDSLVNRIKEISE